MSDSNIIIKILSNKRMYKRVVYILLLVLPVVAYGFYCGEISRIIGAIFGGK